MTYVEIGASIRSPAVAQSTAKSTESWLVFNFSRAGDTGPPIARTTAQHIASVTRARRPEAAAARTSVYGFATACVRRAQRQRKGENGKSKSKRPDRGTPQQGLTERHARSCRQFVGRCGRAERTCVSPDDRVQARRRYFVRAISLASAAEAAAAPFAVEFPTGQPLAPENLVLPRGCASNETSNQSISVAASGAAVLPPSVAAALEVDRPPTPASRTPVDARSIRSRFNRCRSWSPQARLRPASY